MRTRQTKKLRAIVVCRCRLSLRMELSLAGCRILRFVEGDITNIYRFSWPPPSQTVRVTRHNRRGKRQASAHD